MNVKRSLYSRIAGLNTSVRDKKNVLEVKLERSEAGAKFNLSDEETYKLLRCLKISVSDCEAVQACPVGKGVVFITLKPNVDINQFLHWRNESFSIKDGIQTGRIAPSGKKELSVLINGLHPETKDEVVMSYLDAHGKVCRTEPVIHHVYKSGPLKGLKDGTRSYMVNLTKPLGSYHIIDDTKVTVRYRGQIRTCAKEARPAKE